MYIIVCILIISQIILVLGSYTLVPSQVLLPRTSFYRCKKTNELLTVNVQFVLKVEPALCVNWKLQNPLVLVFDKNNYTALQKLKGLEESEELEQYKEDELKGCSPSVVVTTVPLDFKDDTDNNQEEDSEDGKKTNKEELKSNNDVRTFVFAYDSKFRFHAVAEVLISKLDRLTVETSYRKISKNQTFSVKLRGLDKEGNTFSSLEGMAFYMSLEGPKVLEVMRVKEGELYSEKREEVLSQEHHFELPENSVLVTDLVVLKGVKVGRVNVKFGLFFEEYKQVYSTPVEFVVNDSVVLSNQNVYMLNNTSFQLRLQYPKVGTLYPNGKGEDINLLNYEWSTDGDETKVTLGEGGLLRAHLPRKEEDGENVQEEEYKCVVYVKDLRTNEVLKSFVNVSKPYALTLNYNSLNNFNSCMTRRNLMYTREGEFTKEEELEGFLEKLLESKGGGEEEEEECYEKGQKNVVYLFENNYYVFKFNLLTYNKNVFNTFDGSSIKLSQSESGNEQHPLQLLPEGEGELQQGEKEGMKGEGRELLKLVKSKENYQVYKAVSLGCSDYSLTYSRELGTQFEEESKLMNKFKFCVLEQVKLQGFEPYYKYKAKDGKEYTCCDKPLVVSVGDVFELQPTGGTGVFRYELEGCYNEGNQFLCTERGSYLLRVVDANNQENSLALQVVATTLKGSKFYIHPTLKIFEEMLKQELLEQQQELSNEGDEEEVNVKVGREFKVMWRLYGDLEGVNPIFKNQFAQEDGLLYTFNYSNANYLTTKRRGEYRELEEPEVKSEALKLIQYDKKVLEMTRYKREVEGSWILNFRPLEPKTTKLEVNLGWLRDFYGSQKKDKGFERRELLESEFKSLVVKAYRDPVLYVDDDYKLPIINLSTLKKRAKEEELANLPLGSKVELNYKFGIKKLKPKLNKIVNNNVLYIENKQSENQNKLKEEDEKEGFVLYCLNLGEEELVFEHMDYKKEYKVKCSMPKYNRVYPVNEMGKDMYELVLDSSNLELNRQEGYEKKYLVNRNEVNRFVNVMFDKNGELLLPSKMYESEFQVYLLESEKDKASSESNRKETERLLENKKGNVLEFKFDYSNLHNYSSHSKDEEERLLKVVGTFRYANDAKKYSSKFNQDNKFKKFNQLVVNSLKTNDWKFENKQYVLKNLVKLYSTSNHQLLLPTPSSQPFTQLSVSKYSKEDYNKEKSEKNVYLMYNQGFVYRMYVFGGSGDYKVVSQSKEVEFSVSNVCNFPEKGTKKEKEEVLDLLMRRNESLPVKVNEKGEKVINLFNVNDLKGKGRFVTFTTNNLNEVYLRVMDEGMLWQQTLNLKFHLKSPNELKMVLTPFTGERREGAVMGENEEMLYVNEKFELRGFGYYNGNELLGSTMLLKVKLLDKSLSFNNYNLYNFESNEGSFNYTNNDEFWLNGEEKLELVTRELGKAEFEVSDVEGRFVKNYKLKVVEKPVLNYSKVVVVPGTKFDIGFENVNNYRGLEVRLREVGKDEERLDNYTLEFKDEGSYNYEVNLMYEKNPLTNLKEKLKVKVARPSRMRVEVGTMEKRKVKWLEKKEERDKLEDSLEEYEVERNSVVNLNVLLQENQEFFTPLYMKNKKLDFEYTFNKSCQSLNLNTDSTDVNYTDDKDNYNEDNSDQLRTKRYDVLMLVKEDCEVTVTTKYEGKLLQSKKLKFKTKVKEQLFKTEMKLDQLQELNLGLCCRELEESQENNLCYKGVYEINKRFKTYPENRLEHLGGNMYRVTEVGNTLLTTQDNTFNLKLLKPTHFSLVPTSESVTRSQVSLGNEQERFDTMNKGLQTDEIDFESYNMKELVFKVVLYSNLVRLKTPKNSQVKVKMKDLSVFSYELKDDLLVLKPNKFGDTTLELQYSFLDNNLSYSPYNFNKEDDSYNYNKDKDYKDNESPLGRIYFVKSSMDEVSSVVRVYRGAKVYLSGGRMNGLTVNLDVNSHEFEKYLKNKNLVKTFGVNCLGFECGVSYVNRSEQVDSVEKLRNLINNNRTSYRVMMNVVTESLNTLLNLAMSEREELKEKEKLLTVNRMEERYHCNESKCWVSLRYKTLRPFPQGKVRSANELMNKYYANLGGYRGGEEVEEVLKMLMSPLMGFESTMWNTMEGVVNNEWVKTEKLGLFKYKNVNNEQLEVKVEELKVNNYKFTQVNSSTVLLLPKLKEEEVRLGNQENVVYENYKVKYQFTSQQLNKLFYLKFTNYPYNSYNYGLNRDNVDNNKESKEGLLFRLGCKILLVNRYNREWSVLKNQLRTMSPDVLKGKHKVKLELWEGEDRRRDSLKGEERLMEQELEVQLPENVLFVDSEGFVLSELTEKNMNQILHVYPVNSSYTLFLNNNNYLIKTVEKSGQLTTFTIYSNSSNPYYNYNSVDNLFSSRNKENNSNYRDKDNLMVLNENNEIVGKIRLSSHTQVQQTTSQKLNIWNGRNVSDLVLFGLTLLILVFFFVVYNTLRNHHYYQPTVPIKLERTLPKVFDHLHQTNYHYNSQYNY